MNCKMVYTDRNPTSRQRIKRLLPIAGLCLSCSTADSDMLRWGESSAAVSAVYKQRILRFEKTSPDIRAKHKGDEYSLTKEKG